MEILILRSKDVWDIVGTCRLPQDFVGVETDRDKYNWALDYQVQYRSMYDRRETIYSNYICTYVLIISPNCSIKFPVKDNLLSLPLLLLFYHSVN